MVAGRSAGPASPCGLSPFTMYFQIRADKIGHSQCSDSCNQKMAHTKEYIEACGKMSPRLGAGSRLLPDC